MTTQNIKIEIVNQTAQVVLNRPEVKNALSLEMINDLNEVIKGFATDDEVKCVVITGTGGDFCSGADLGGVKDDTSFVMKGCRSAQELVSSILMLEKPVIAAIDGYATAGGCELALACDIRIASNRARLGELFIRIGLIPGMIGIYLLPRLIGPGLAKEFVFTGDLMDAAEAYRVGMVNKVVSPEDLSKEALKLASKLAAGPTKAIGKAKAAINRGLDSDLQGSLDHMFAVQMKLAETSDHQEGVTAFLEKRKACFQGK